MGRTILFYIEKNKKILRFFVSGSAATSVDLFLLFFFTEIVGFWYIYSAILAFGSSFFVSFYMQKYWTFEDEREDIKVKQMVFYFLVASYNLVLNTTLLFFFVSFFSIHYLLSQLIAVCLMGFGSFLFYNLIIFKKSLKHEDSSGQK